MRRTTIIAAALALASLTVTPLHADTLKLKNGQVLEGKVISEDKDGDVRFKVGDETTNYSADEIRSISKGKGAAPAPAAQPGAAPAAAPAASAAPAGNAVMVPGGTPITVKLDNDISAEHAQGTKFTAVLETNVLANGKTAVPAGTKAYGLLEEAQQQGMVGQASMKIRLTGFNIGGNVVPIKTDLIGGKGERKARQATKGAAVGAGIGAAAGGGSGAATGAMIGAAASTLRKKSVGIPAGTVLEFHLVEPLTITP